jgi:hypothetical protein
LLAAQLLGDPGRDLGIGGGKARREETGGLDGNCGGNGGVRQETPVAYESWRGPERANPAAGLILPYLGR